MEPVVIKPDPADEYDTPERCHILELSNSPNDEELSIARARVEPGVTTAWHRVEETAERYVILEGQGQVELGENSPQDVMVGDIVIIPPNVNQRIANTGDTDLVFLALCTPRFRPERYFSTE